MHDVVLVHYGEIALKGKNRSFFEKKLVENIEEKTKSKVERKRGFLKIDLDSGNLSLIEESLKKTFGIAWFAFAYSCEKDINKINKIACKHADFKKTMKVEANRVDKTFPMTSMEINRKVGEALFKKGAKISMKPEKKIFVEVADDAYVFFEKQKGLGGLPVGVSGKVAVLFSGGIDSPVAAWMMMKRGCSIELLHFHALKKNSDVKKTKIYELAQKLSSYHRVRLHVVPFHDFSVASLDLASYEMVMFKRFMTIFAERFAAKNGIKAIVTGDNLSQVASQTMGNINAVSHCANVQIFRPLIGFDKQEIIELAQKVGTYETSIKKYKDCCSIVAKNPEINASVEKVNELEKKINMGEIIEKSLKLMETIDIN
jgi:thiamine biosynthesis protein ThiI